MLTVDPAAGYRGITAFLVERGQAGFTVGRKEDKLGIRASSTCELLFDGCRVSRANVLGEVGKGYKVAIETLNEGRIGIGAQMVGIAQGALDAALRYVKERRQFGKPLAANQLYQKKLADMQTEITLGLNACLTAGRLMEEGRLAPEAISLLKRNNAGKALAIAAIGSFIAGTLATCVIALVAVPMTSIALKFG